MPALDAQHPPVSVVIPYFRNEDYIERVVDGISRALDKADTEGEIIIVDDFSRDGVSLNRSGKVSVRTVHLPKHFGVSGARNRGAVEAKNDFILFVDSDVVINEDAILNSQQSLQAEKDLDFVIGTLNPKTSSRYFFGKFNANWAAFNWSSMEPDKVKHEVDAMWSQFLFARKAPFFSIGAFDVSREKPSLEDVELGIRARLSQKKILFDKRIQNTHLKDFSFRKIVDSYFGRAIDWTDLRLTHKSFKWKSYESKEMKLSFLASFFSLPAIALSVFSPSFLFLLPVLFSVFVFANRKFLNYGRVNQGSLFALKCLPLLYFVNLISLVGVAVGTLKHIKLTYFSDTFRYLRLFKNYLFKPIGSIESLTLFVTNKCNFSCSYCCYGEHLNKREEVLSLEELEKISKNIGPLENITFTGGEPFLRRDMPQLVKLFYDNSKMRKAIIISNGSMPEKVRRDVLEILQSCPKLSVIISFSHEGSEEVHEDVRGVGSYAKLQQSARILNELSLLYPNLKVGHIFTMHEKNQDRLPSEVSEHNENGTKLVTISLQRGNADNRFVEGLKIEKYNELCDITYQMNVKKSYYFLFGGVVRRAKRIAQRLNALTYQDRSYKTPCYAGRINATLYNTGFLHPCEMLRENYGNVRDHDYDINRMLRTAYAKQVTKPIIKDKCFCTHECNQITNVLFNPRYLPQLLFGK